MATARDDFVDEEVEEEQGTARNNEPNWKMASELSVDSVEPPVERQLHDLCGRGEDFVHEHVEEWFRVHKSKDVRYDAANYRGEFGMKALHLAARNALPFHVIEEIFACCPDVVREADEFGWLPMHYASACASGTALAVLSFLHDAYPQSLTAQDRRGRTPLHFFCGVSSNVVDNETIDIVNLLVSDAEAAILIDEHGMLPIHYACAYMGGRERISEALEVMRAPHPWTIAAQDARGRTPLHFAMSNAHNGASPEVLRFLLRHGAEHNIIGMRDNDGRLALANMKMISEDIRSDQGQRTTLRECLPIVIEALQGLPDEGFIVLQGLPPWLQAEAFKNPGHALQSALNAHISKPFPTMILMLDLYFSIALIACFHLVSTAYLDCIFGNNALPSANQLSPYLELVLGCGIYFLIRELTQIISLGSAGLLKRVWLRDATNLIDVISVAVTFMWFGLMFGRCEGTKEAIEHSARGEWYRAGLSITIGLYWLSFLLLLRAMSPSFAVFMGGMFHVMRSLVMFLIFLIITLVAFAQMFFFVFRQTSFCLCRGDYSGELSEAQEQACAQNPDHEGASFCTLEESLLQVYFMLAGEIETDLVTYSPLSTFVACFFIFLAVILLLNVLIAIVTNAYIFVQDISSASVFWSQRFAFLAEVKAITVFTTRCLRIGRKESKPEQEVSPDLQLYGGYEDRKRDRWRQAVAYIDPVVYEEAEPNCCEAFVYVVAGIFVLLALILWVVAGIVTFGLLWPPQVREWLLQRHMSVYTDTRGTAAALTDSATKEEYRELKDEVNKVTKQNEDISRQNAEIKELLLSVLNQQNSKEMSVRLDSSGFVPL